MSLDNDAQQEEEEEDKSDINHQQDNDDIKTPSFRVTKMTYDDSVFVGKLFRFRASEWTIITHWKCVIMVQFHSHLNKKSYDVFLCYYLLCDRFVFIVYIYLTISIQIIWTNPVNEPNQIDIFNILKCAGFKPKRKK